MTNNSNESASQPQLSSTQLLAMFHFCFFFLCLLGNAKSLITPASYFLSLVYVCVDACIGMYFRFSLLFLWFPSLFIPLILFSLAFPVPFILDNISCSMPFLACLEGFFTLTSTTLCCNHSKWVVFRCQCVKNHRTHQTLARVEAKSSTLHYERHADQARFV